MRLSPSFIKEQIHEKTRWIFVSTESVLTDSGGHLFSLEDIPLNETGAHVVVTPWLLDEANANAKSLVTVNVVSTLNKTIQFRAAWTDNEGASDALIRFDFCITQEL